MDVPPAPRPRHPEVGILGRTRLRTGYRIGHDGGVQHVAASAYKRAIPRVDDHVLRPGLLERLSREARRSPLVWVVGLPGAGKTSLVARWVTAQEATTFWYRLDASDDDVAPLFDGLRAAAGATRSLPVWSPENQADLADFARAFFAELAREPVVLVLDDCHRVADTSPTLAVLEHAREIGPESLRIVLVSRRGPPPALARGVVGGWLGLVDGLRLEPDEARRIASAVRGKPLDDGEARALDRAGGWLAHVLALARARTSEAELPPDLDQRVGDFLAAELLASVPRDQRAGLRRLAELPEIPKDLGPPFLTAEASRLLTSLAEQRWFVDLVEGRWRLHDLLRDALRAMNAALDERAELDRARRDLASRVATTLPEAAMQLRVDARDVASTIDLLEAKGKDWLAHGLHHTVAAWLKDLEEPDDVAAQAALASWRALAMLPTEPEAARPLFAKARRLGKEARDPARAYAAWCGEVSSYVVQWGAVHGLADLVDDLEALEKELGPPPGDLGFRTSEGALTALMYGRAEDPRITRYADATARAIEHAPDAGARISAAAQLLIYRLWWAGDFPGGRALYDTFDAEVARGEDLPPLARLIWWSCASIVDWQCGEPSACYEKVERGLALAASSGVHVRDFFLLTQGIFCALSQEDWTRAEGYLVQLARTERNHLRLDAMVHHFFRSWYSLCRGDARTALAHAESAWPMAEAMGSMFHKVIVLSALAPARVHAGDLEGAEQAYRAQLALAKAARNPTFSYIAFCSAAEIAMAKKDEPALAKQVERILFVKALGGFHSGCGWRMPMMRDVLAFALEKGIQPQIARQWIREKRIPPPALPPAGWPMPVRIEAKDGLVVHVEGGAGEDAETKKGKPAQKLRELLAVLVARPSGATQAELSDWLWPDAEGDKASASLKVAVHRLRQWLGADAVRVQDGRTSLNPSLVGCDVWGPPNAIPDAERVLHGFDFPPVEMLRRRLKAGMRAS